MAESNYRYTLDYPEFLQEKFGNMFIDFESMWAHFLYILAGYDKYQVYNSFKLAINNDDENLFYFKLDSDNYFELDDDHYFDLNSELKHAGGVLSTNSLSLTAMIFLVSHLIGKLYDDKGEVFNRLVELKYKLKDEAEKSSQSKLSFNFID